MIDAVSGWEGLLAARQFGAAHKAFMMDQQVAEAAQTDPVGIDSIRRSLATLADLQQFVRERSFARASERLSRHDERADIAPWAELEAHLSALAESSNLLDRREPDEALTALDALNGSWFLAEVHTQRGTAHIFKGEFEEAKAAFEAALELDAEHFRALTNLGNVALEEKRTDEAIDYYERALKLNADFANAHHNLGVALRRKGNLGKSVKSLKTAQRLASKQEASEARSRLGRWSPSPGVKRYFRWLLIGAALAVAYYLFLR